MVIRRDEQALLDRAVNTARGKERGRSFQLTDVVDTKEWEAMPTGRRRALGRRFKVMMQRNNEFKLAEKDGANHQLYIRAA